MRGSETMNRYLCLVILAVGAAVLPSGAADMKDYPLIVYRGTLINGANGKPADLGGGATVEKTMVFSAYDSESPNAQPRWTSGLTNVTVNANGSFETALGDDRLWSLVVSGVVTHVGMALYSQKQQKVLPEITPRRAIRPLAAVNRALVAEGAAADISIGTLTAKNLEASVLAVESLEASAAVTGSRALGIGVGRFTVAKDERTRVVGREIRMFNAPRRVATVQNPVRGQELWTATGNGTVLVHTTSAGERASLRIPGVVQIVRTGDVVRAPCSERGNVSVEYYPFAGNKGSEVGK